MYAGMPESQTGTFSMTVVTLRSAFEGHNPDNGYKSKSFERFAENINRVHGRVEEQYVGAIYPEGTTLAGSVYNPENGGVNPYSADVLIPAF
jgi:cell surface protein SprA